MRVSTLNNLNELLTVNITDVMDSLIKDYCEYHDIAYRIHEDTLEIYHRTTLNNYMSGVLNVIYHCIDWISNPFNIHELTKVYNLTTITEEEYLKIASTLSNVIYPIFDDAYDNNTLYHMAGYMTIQERRKILAEMGLHHSPYSLNPNSMIRQLRLTKTNIKSLNHRRLRELFSVPVMSATSLSCKVHIDIENLRQIVSDANAEHHRLELTTNKHCASSFEDLVAYVAFIDSYIGGFKVITDMKNKVFMHDGKVIISKYAVRSSKGKRNLPALIKGKKAMPMTELREVIASYICEHGPKSYTISIAPLASNEYLYLNLVSCLDAGNMPKVLSRVSSSVEPTFKYTETDFYMTYTPPGPSSFFDIYSYTSLVDFIEKYGHQCTTFEDILTWYVNTYPSDVVFEVYKHERLELNKMISISRTLKGKDFLEIAKTLKSL